MTKKTKRKQNAQQIQRHIRMENKRENKQFIQDRKQKKSFKRNREPKKQKPRKFFYIQTGGKKTKPEGFESRKLQNFQRDHSLKKKHVNYVNYIHLYCSLHSK